MRPSKRDSLLDAAERLFYEHGFHATGIDRVVGDAGVARMTLYNHFPSKEALVESVLARRYRRYLEDLRQAVDERGSAPAVMALVERHGEWLRTVSTQGCIVIRAIGEFERHNTAIADLGRQLKRDLLALIADALARDGLPRDAALPARVLVVLEGADALGPVLGPGPATEHMRAIVPLILASAQEAPA